MSEIIRPPAMAQRDCDSNGLSATAKRQPLRRAYEFNQRIVHPDFMENEQRKFSRPP